MNSPVRLPAHWSNTVKPVAQTSVRNLYSNTANTDSNTVRGEKALNRVEGQETPGAHSQKICPDSSPPVGFDQAWQGEHSLRMPTQSSDQNKGEKPLVDHEQAQEHISSPGQSLRIKRGHLRLSIDEVARRLKLPVKHVNALEWDEWGRLPKGPFARGYLRNYAILLGLDASELLSNYDIILGVKRQDQSEQSQKLWWQDAHLQRLGLALIAAILLVGIALYWPAIQTMTGFQEPASASQAIDRSQAVVMSQVKDPGETDFYREVEGETAITQLREAEGSTGDRLETLGQVSSEAFRKERTGVVNPAVKPANTIDVVHVDSVFGDQITVETSDDGRVIYRVATEQLSKARASQVLPPREVSSVKLSGSAASKKTRLN